LPGSGKSVVSQALQRLLENKNVRAELLSSDGLRRVLTPNPSYALKERDTVYEMLVFIAEILTRNDVNVIIDATGNLRRYRDAARRRIPKFMEVYLKCPVEVCMEREGKRANTYFAPRQIYGKALKGKAPTVPGVGQPYEPPLNPEVTIDTTQCTPERCARRILEGINALKTRKRKG
jgi:adenylylsulfate kinase